MERFVVVAVDSTCEPRKPSAGSSRAARCALRSLRSLQCLRHRESKALPSSRRMAPRTPGFPEPASPFQSARSPGDPPAVPGRLKGRAAVDPFRARQAPQRSEERGSKDATRLSSLREIADFPRAVRTRRVLTTSRESFALSNDSEPRSGRAPRGLSRLSRFIPRPIPLNHPYHAQA